MGMNGEKGNTPLLLAPPKIKLIIGLDVALKGLISSLHSGNYYYDEPFAQGIFHLLVMEAMSYTETWTDTHYVEQAVDMLIEVSSIPQEVSMDICRECSSVIYSILTMHLPHFGSKVMDGKTTYQILPNNTDIFVEFPSGVANGQ